VREMELEEALQIGGKLAEYFVYYCGEGDHYVELITQLRAANTRYTLLEAVYILLHYGERSLGKKMDGMSKKRMKELFVFFRTGEIKQVSRFRSTLNNWITTYELEKIHQQERYLVELLS
jgi:hypothetical protein